MRNRQAVLRATAIGLVLVAFAIVLPAQRLQSLGGRMLPILLFLATITIVVNLSDRAGVFRSIARATARVAENRPLLLWLLICATAVVSTAFLSLDTTAVLVTPLAISLVRTNQGDILPALLAVVWIANIGSMWLPVSNLTNLLAVQSDVFTSSSHFLNTTGPSAAIGVGITMIFTYLIFHRRVHSGPTWGDSKGPKSESDVSSAAHVHPANRFSALLLAIMLPLLATPVPYWITTTIAASILVLVFLRHDRHAMSIALVPWGVMGYAAALVAGIEMLHVLGVEEFIQSAFNGEDAEGLLSLMMAGALSSNIVNNLPAFLLLEPAAGSPVTLTALLIGTNAGPVITPWASLATLLWADQIRRAGLVVPWRRFVLCGLALGPLACMGMLLPLLA